MQDIRPKGMIEKIKRIWRYLFADFPFVENFNASLDYEAYRTKRAENGFCFWCGQLSFQVERYFGLQIQFYEFLPKMFWKYFPRLFSRNVLYLIKERQ